MAEPEPERNPDDAHDEPDASAKTDTDTETDDERDADRDDAHLRDVEPGAGCTEIWEHLSENRDE